MELQKECLRGADGMDRPRQRLGSRTGRCVPSSAGPLFIHKSGRLRRVALKLRLMVTLGDRAVRRPGSCGRPGKRKSRFSLTIHMGSDVCKCEAESVSVGRPRESESMDLWRTSYGAHV